MGGLIHIDQNTWLEIAHDGAQSLPTPFEEEIYLFTTYVAGTKYCEGGKELAQSLKKEELLELYREPTNSFDENAIVVRTTNGAKLGYIPHHDNAVFSRLMDAGKLVYAKIKDIQEPSIDSAFDVDIDIYLKD